MASSDEFGVVVYNVTYILFGRSSFSFLSSARFLKFFISKSYILSMGVAQSADLPSHFQKISEWPKSKVESVIQSYNDGEYDFGIDYSVVMNITGYDENDARELIQAHNKNDTGFVNAITLLISLISLGNGESRNEVHRLECIFDLMDFNHSGHISMDEFTILLLCIGSSYSFILQRSPDEGPIDEAVIQFGKAVYDGLGKKFTVSIGKVELVEWTKENVFGKGITSINDILGVIINGLSTGGEDKPGDASVASSITNF